MNTNSRRLMRTIAMLAASAALCTTALADSGQGQARGGGNFSSGRSGHNAGAHHGGRSHAGRSEGARSYGAPRGSSARSSSAPRGGGSFSSGRSPSASGNVRSYRADPGRAASRPDFNSGSYRSGVRIPDATRPGYTAGAHPRAGFSTTRPDFGTRNNTARSGVMQPGLTTRPDLNGRGDSYRRPGVNTGRVDGNRGRDLNTRPDFNGRNNFSRAPDSNGRRHFDRRPGFDSRSGFHKHPRYSTHRGFNHGSGFSHRRHWHGGHWHGRYWPRAYYHSNFVSFWPVLPAAYATFWYGGTSYYYVNDLYYTWSPARYGYVVTDPPPVAATATTEVEEVDAAADDPGVSGSASVYVYPRNGQSEQQTADDRYECHQWAVSQTGFDPTTASGDTVSPDSAADYRRALIACLDGRGYSAN